MRTRIERSPSSSFGPAGASKYTLRTIFRMKSVTTELGELTQHNVKQLKVLNRDIFPVVYNEKFYKDLLEAGPLCKLGKQKSFRHRFREQTQRSIWTSLSRSIRMASRSYFSHSKVSRGLNERSPWTMLRQLSILAYCNDIVVGALCCRFDLSDNLRRLYIMTLGVLPKYRELGLGKSPLIALVGIILSLCSSWLGTLMLKHALKICDDDSRVDSIYLYVDTGVNLNFGVCFF